MTDPDLNPLSDGQFKRWCGVSRPTFAEGIKRLRPHLERTRRQGGQAKLSVGDPSRMVWEYWRDDTQFLIGVSGDDRR